MKFLSRSSLRLTFVLALIVACGLSARAADPAEAAKLAAVLKSDASPRDKDAACAQLKRLGGAAEVPALAALLTDEALSHSARYALESMPAPEAGRALIDALPKTKGLTQAGIIQSLGERREAAASAALAKLLDDADPVVAEAAANALGRIGGEQALAALKAGMQTPRVTTRDAILDALLAIGNRMIKNNAPAAKALFGTLYNSPLPCPDNVRVGAFRGMILTSGDELINRAMLGSDASSQMAVLIVARELKTPEIMVRLAKLLPMLAPPLRIAAIEVLGQCGDRVIAPALADCLPGPDEEVSLAAIRAMGEVGDAGSVFPLSYAVDRSPALKKAARQALLDLRQGDVTRSLIVYLTNAKPTRQAELVRALVGRGEKNTAEKLLPLAQKGPATARAAACEALGQLAGAAQLSAMLKLVLDSKDAAARTETSAALLAVCRRIQERGERCDTAPLLQALASGPVETRAALLPAAGALVDPGVREALRAALKATEPALHEAATQALTQTSDPELLPDLLALVKQTSEAQARTMAVRGYLNLAAAQSNAGVSDAQRITALKAILPELKQTEEQWLALSALAKIPSLDSLALAQTMLANPATQAEAAQAILKIAAALQATHGAEARAALNNVKATVTDPNLRAAAEAHLTGIEALAGFITAWKIAGPYQQTGKTAQELFNVALGPEKGEAQAIVWQGLPAGSNPQKPYLMDILKYLGGDSRVAYAQARLFSDADQAARLELGSDDGVKAWLNGKLVVSNNYIGALRVGADKADVKLAKGWNTLLLKVTQNNQMWEFCARLVDLDGKPLPAILADTNLGEMAKPTPTSARPKAGKAKGKAKAGKAKAGKAPAPAAAVAKPNPDAKPGTPCPSGPTPVRFHKTQLDAAFRSEGVAVADFNNDGKLDVATGTMLYLGPDWKPQPMLGAPKEYKQEGYSQEFYCFAEDINKDGWLDLIVIGFPGQQTRWLQNPGKAGGAWKEHLAIAKTGNESPDWLDVDGDGRKELVFISDQGAASAQPGPDPTQPWPVKAIAAPGDPRPGHGLGVGDINGDGRLDVLIPQGWWEAPADRATVPWTFHKAALGFSAPAQMCVYDVNGDGRADVVSSGAHCYGLWWYEQTADGKWLAHEIDGSISQLHALHLADVNGDGLLDIVTGKRFWAHNHNDEGISDPAVLTWFELKREGGKVTWIRHDIDQDSGVGLHVWFGDVNGDGRLDLVTSHKKGVYVFTQER